MKNFKKVFNSKWSKAIIALATIMLVIVIVCIFNVKNKNEFEIDETNIGYNESEKNNQLQTIDAEVVKLSENKYEVNEEENTLSFNDSVGTGMICISSNAQAPTYSDRWVEYNPNNIYTLNDTATQSNDDEVQKVYVYYKAGSLTSDLDNYNGDYDNYIIKSVEGLQKIAELVNGGKDYSEKTIYLNKDLDLSGITYTPIGTETNPFKGTFDGHGYTISSLNIDSTSDYVGLFGYSEGNIRNVIVNGEGITGASKVGGIAGFNAGEIENCINNIPIEGTSMVGGIVGNGWGTIRYCENNAPITASSMAGGIIGNTGDNANIATNETTVSNGEDLTIFNCKNTATVTTSGIGTGGTLIGVGKKLKKQ